MRKNQAHNKYRNNESMQVSKRISQSTIRVRCRRRRNFKLICIATTTLLLASSSPSSSVVVVAFCPPAQKRLHYYYYDDYRADGHHRVLQTKKISKSNGIKQQRDFLSSTKNRLAKSVSDDHYYYCLSMSSEETDTADYDQKDSKNNNNAKKAKWLSWLQSGEKRGVEEVKMREASALGGVPRSDRYSSKDWFHNTRNLPSSDILKSVRGPVMFMSSWAGFLSLWYTRLSYTDPVAAAKMCIPHTTHSLMVSALGLLLVFRTNSAYQRFVEGRKIWGEIVNSARDLYRYIMMYETEIGIEKRRRIQRLLAAFPYLLRHRVRPNLVMHRVDDELIQRDPKNTLLLYQDRALPDNDPEAAKIANQEANSGKSRRKTRTLYWVDKRTLPWRLLPPGALENCARAQNRPLWVIDRMAQELRSVPDGPGFTNRERLTLISHVDKLSRLIGDCERIHQTSVPLNYARHSLRALTLWLFTLPFALLNDLKLLTSPALFLVSWLLFGVYEIGVAIEDPFQGTLRLSIICDIIRRDVLGDEVIRGTAFDLDKSTLDGDEEEEEEDEEDDEVKYYGGENDAVVAGENKTNDEVISARCVQNKLDDNEEPKAFE